MTLERHRGLVVVKNRGAIQCYVLPGGWLYVQSAGRIVVTVLDSRSGGLSPVQRGVLPDKIVARMTPAEVRAARKAGRLIETPDGYGFHLSPSP